ncbi:MFS transporter [Sessilibacter corallicola]|uniref:MFS transporter n=1 Tax=Sessilibacter corallicola TaxID=2904075 RepID=UPI001E3548C9|nr:MFS transporter [Sessilibacter corallicola]MCE2028550.1 MFS transporter [Sessilibacter corallicola]
MNSEHTSDKHTFLILLIALGTLAGMGATDLILPAIPSLPDVLDGTPSQAQGVLATYVLGAGIGLIIFGELGARFKIIHLLIMALVFFSILSLAATFVTSLTQLSVIRFLQGIFASAAAVYAPVMIKSVFANDRAVIVIGRISSLEAMAPAIAPIFGAILLNSFGWRSSFYVIAVIGLLLSITWMLQGALKEKFGIIKPAQEGYASLIKKPDFMRYLLSHAFTLGALLTVVLSAPKIITGSLNGELHDFIVMQILGISLFVIAANMTPVFNRWWGDENSIVIGSVLTAVGCLALLFVAYLQLNSIVLLWLCFMIINLGVGIRGPVGFYKTLVAAGENDSRGSALLILFIMLFTAIGTATVAPFINAGLMPLSVVVVSSSILSVFILLFPVSRPVKENLD